MELDQVIISEITADLDPGIRVGAKRACVVDGTDDENAMVRLDMSEYADAQAVLRLTGDRHGTGASLASIARAAGHAVWPAELARDPALAERLRGPNSPISPNRSDSSISANTDSRPSCERVEMAMRPLVTM